MSNRPKILSIDDNKTSQKLLEKALGKDYEISTATSAFAGLKLLSQINPHALILDADMPEIDGYKLCRMIRAQPEFANIPILFVTCPDQQQDHSRAFQAGGSDYITEPLNIISLKEKLQLSLTRQPSAQRERPVRGDNNPKDQYLSVLHTFLVHLIALESDEKVAKAVVNALDQLQLKGAVVLHNSGDIVSSIGPLTDLESVLLQQATTRYPAAYAARYIWGDKHLGCMVQNMPLDKSDFYQQLVQLLDAIFSAANEKLAALSAQHATPSPRPSYAAPTSSLERISLHLETALHDLEQLNEKQWQNICLQLGDWLDEARTGEPNLMKLQGVLNQCIKARVAAFDQCRETQSLCSNMLSHINRKDTA